MRTTRQNVGTPFTLLTLSVQHTLGRITAPNLRTRARGRFTLLKALPKRSAGAEIGVWKGSFSRLLIETLNPRTLYLIDPWRLSSQDRPVLPRSKDGTSLNIRGETITSQADLDEIYLSVQHELGGLPGTNVIRATSLEAADKVPNGSLDWVYLDGSHYYEDVKNDLSAWTPKLIKSGIMCGDDYYWRDPNGLYTVKQAVDEYIATMKPSHWSVYKSQFVIYI